MRALDLPPYPDKPSVKNRISSSPASTFLLSFAGVYLILILLLRSIAQRDPGSWFFDPKTAYLPRYSVVRTQQADAYIAALPEHTPETRTYLPGAPTNSNSRQICVGIASVARERARYLGTAVGSLLQGLTQEEREDIHLKVLIAHTNPLEHPDYLEPWLTAIVDEVLLYKNLSQTQLQLLKNGERDRGKLEKWVHDYAYLLKSCHATGAEYIAVLEDDVLAVDGWYSRVFDGLVEAESHPQRVGSKAGFLYLRLFYSEEFLGWNVEDWFEHTLWSILLVAIVAASIYGLCSWNPHLNRAFTLPTTTSICCIAMPLLIVLFFATGRVTWNPLPHGIVKMNTGGCCSQGMVYPRDKVDELVRFLEAKGAGFVDLLIEEYANKHDALRWALVPSVLQHVGRRSSKGDDFGENSKHGMALAEKVWNFEYEEFYTASDHDVLRSRGRVADVEIDRLSGSLPP